MVVVAAQARNGVGIINNCNVSMWYYRSSTDGSPEDVTVKNLEAAGHNKTISSIWEPYRSNSTVILLQALDDVGKALWISYDVTNGTIAYQVSPAGFRGYVESIWRQGILGLFIDERGQISQCDVLNCRSSEQDCFFSTTLPIVGTNSTRQFSCSTSFNLSFALCT